VRFTAVVSTNSTVDWTRPVAGAAMALDVFKGTGGGSVCGFGPLADQPPKYVAMTWRARAGVTSPTTTMVVRSGRYALA